MPSSRSSDVVLGPVRLPRVIALLIAVTAVLSIAAAVGGRTGAAGIASAGLFAPLAVLEGQVWRLVTWTFFELEPIGLIFACLMLVWFGRDLAQLWGPRRFLAAYVGLAALGAAVTTALALVWPELQGRYFAGAWPAIDGLVVAWGLLHPTRQINLYGVLPLSGRHLVGLTVGMTILFALFRGFAPFVPHLVIVAGTLAWFGPLRRWTSRSGRKAAKRPPPGGGQVFSFEDWHKKNRN